MADGLRVVVNGEAIELATPCSVLALLTRYGLEASPSAVEVNTRLVPRREHETHFLEDGDRIEIVTLVGGG